MSDVELLPCPFCNSEPKLRYIGNDRTKARKITVKCTGCRIEVTHAAIRNGFDFLEAAIKITWNSRVLNKKAIENAAYDRAAQITDKYSKALDHGNNEYLRSRDCQNAASDIRKMKSSPAGEDHVVSPDKTL